MLGARAAPRVATAAADGAEMAALPGGPFLMGSDRHYPEERPQREAAVSPFRIDRFPVTNAQYADFVAATGYATVAERAPDPREYPGVDASVLVPGSLVFTPPADPVPPLDFRRWWSYVPGACWRRPEGPRSSIEGRENHPVVHVAFADAEAYADWTDKALPTEAEWEYAARGGLEGADFIWGDDFTPDGRHFANTWQGQFPWQNLEEDGFYGTSPAGSFPPNGFGLYDMAGNVWEWTATDYVDGGGAPCCAPAPTVAESRKVLKGGSFLCAPNYCRRYRPAARQGEAMDSAASHIGFRCIERSPPRS